MADMMQQEAKFYYKTPELTHRYELIQHLLEYSNHLILVQGEKDTGKTSLYNQLTTPDESSLVMIKLSASAHTSQSDILNAMVADMTATSDTFDPWGSSIEDFHNWLGRCHSKQQIPALLIDDVDLLDDELIDFIFSELSVPRDETSLHVCLFCEPSFLELARKKGLDENESQSLHIIEMPHLNEKQTAQYLNHKYPDSESDLSIFDEKTVKQIHRISHGMPGRINVLAEQYLNDPAKEVPEESSKTPEPTETKNSYNRAIIVVVVLLLLLSVGVAYLLNRTDEPTTSEIAVDLPQQQVPAQDTALSSTGQEQTLEQADTTSTMPAAVTSPVTVNETGMEETTGQQNTIEILEPAGEAPAQQDQPVTAPASELAQQSEQELDALEDIEIDTGLVATRDETATSETVSSAGENESVETEVTSLPVSTELLITGVDANTEAEANTSSVQEQSTPARTPAESTTAAETENEAGVSTNSRDISWLLQQPPNNYVLQLIGAHEVQTVDAYLRSIPTLAGEAIRFTTTNNDKPWHVVVYGLYDNRQQAVAAIEALPELAQATSPWPRPVKSIKELVLQ